MNKSEVKLWILTWIFLSVGIWIMYNLGAALCTIAVGLFLTAAIYRSI